MQKSRRLIVIEKLIEEEEIPSQGVLLKKLKGKGIACTQATLSRNKRAVIENNSKQVSEFLF